MASINASILNTGVITTGDATGILQLQSNGVTGLTLSNTANVTVDTNLTVSGYEVKPIVSGTVQVATGAANIDFTGIPNWVKKITVMVRGISTTGASHYIIRLGTSGGYVATNYLGSSTNFGGAGTGSAEAHTTGFGFSGDIIAGSIYTGILVIVNMTDTVWVASGSGCFTDSPYSSTSGGAVDAGGVVTSIRLTTVNGTDLFDAGSINILYE